jgi:hypothetical protein
MEPFYIFREAFQFHAYLYPGFKYLAILLNIGNLTL